MRGNRTDANTIEIVDALRKVGAVWVDCTGDPRIGFDGLIAFRSSLLAVELKDGKKAPSARRLTDNEAKRAYQLAHVGVTVHVINNCDEALKLIGATK